MLNSLVFSTLLLLPVTGAPPAPKKPDGISIEDLRRAIGKSHLSNEVHLIRKHIEVEPTAFYKTPDVSGRGFYHNWKGHGISLAFDGDGRLFAVFLYSDGHDEFKAYKGELPQDLTFKDDVAIVKRRIGDPEAVNIGYVDGNNKIITHTEYQYDKKGINVGFSTGSDPEKAKATISYISLFKIKK